MFSREPAAGVKIPEHKVLLNEPVLDYVQVASAEGFLKGQIPGRVLQLPSLTRLGAGGVETLENSPVMYEDFVGMRGDSRLAVGNLSDGFVSSTAFEKIEVSHQNWPAGMGSTPRNVSCNSASGYLGPRVKFMCSCGGKILPRPTDGKLRYVGGETRIISVNRHISYSDLMLKMAECYGQAMILKYQLPDEDLDALISVSSEEDLENMMEEYDRLDAGEGSPRLRVFLFSAAEYDANHLNDEGERRNSEQMYVDAVNGLLESGIRKPVDTGSAGSSQNLMGIDIPDAWYAFQKPDNVPVSLFGSPNPQDVVISVAPSLAPPKQAFPGILLAPTSTLSSSPMSSQSFQTRHFPIPDIVPQSSPGLLGKVNGHQYAASRSDGSHQDPESGGSASSSMASQHDLPHSEFKMVPDSSIKAQHETMMPYGNHPDHMYQAEPWRVVEAVMPRVDSPGVMSGIDPPGRVLRTEPHAKLMRLREQHLEYTQPGLADKKLDNHFSGVLLPQVDLQGLASQQQQQQLTQSDLHHPLEAQQPFSDGSHAQQQVLHQFGSHAQQQVLHQEQVLHFYPPPAAVYKQAEEPQSHDVIPDGNMSYKPSSLETSGTQSVVGIASPDFQIGSSPSSQHLGFWCHTGELQGQQQLQGNQVSDGGFADQQYEWRLHLNDVQLSRAFLPSESVPQYCEQVMLVEDGLTCQQTPIPFVDPKQMLNSGDGKYEPLKAKNYHFDGLKRPALTQTVVDIYDEDAPESLQGHQEANGVPFPAEEHQSLSNHNVNAKLEYREPQQQPRIPTHPFSLERLTEEDGVLLERRKVFDNETAGPAFFSALQVLEGSNPFLIPYADDSHTKAQPQSDQHHDPLGNSSFGIRTGLLPPVTGMHSRAVSRAVVLDAAQAAHLAGKSEAAPTTSQTGTEMPNLKIASAYEELPVRIPASNARDLSVAQRLLEERISGIVSTQAAPLVNSLMPSAGLSTSESFITADSIEGQWDGDFDLPGTELELIGYGQMAQFCEDPMDGKSGLVLNSELCRPASGGNVSMVEDAFDAGSKVDIHSTDCKSLIDDDTLVLPYAMQHHTQASGIATGSSFSVAMNILATKLGTLTLNKASAAQSSTAMASSTPSSFLVERSIPLSSASPVVGLSSHSAPTSISVSFLAEETKDKQETAVEKLGLASATTSEIPFSMTGKSEGKVVLDLALKKEPPANNRNQVNTSGQHACHDHEVDDIKGELKHVAENVAEAVLDSTPYSSATLSVQNWENSLAEAKLEPDTNENLPEEKSLDEVKLDAVTCKEVIFEETKVEDDVPKIKKPSNLAADAVAEAINPGLQVIKNADLEELRELGSGTFGTVYHGKWRGTDVAIKRIKSSCFAGRPSERERLLADFWREARILGLLHHPNVVAFYGVVTDGPGGTLATVTEYMVNGSLKQVLQRKDRNCRTIDRRKRLVIAMDTAFGMEYLHGKKIVHFDLKCDNLLVNMRDPQRPICKVGDLGLSKVKEQTMVSGGVRGTLPWMAPELLNGSSSLVTDKVDVFSFGIVMWELLTGEEPYANMHYGAIIGGIVNNTLRPPIPSWCDPAWKSLMERCWSADPLERPNFQQIAAELRAMAASFHGRGQGQSHTTGQVQTQM